MRLAAAPRPPARLPATGIRPAALWRRPTRRPLARPRLLRAAPRGAAPHRRAADEDKDRRGKKTKTRVDRNHVHKIEARLPSLDQRRGVRAPLGALNHATCRSSEGASLIFRDTIAIDRVTDSHCRGPRAGLRALFSCVKGPVRRGPTWLAHGAHADSRAGAEVMVLCTRLSWYHAVAHATHASSRTDAARDAVMQTNARARGCDTHAAPGSHTRSLARGPLRPLKGRCGPVCPSGVARAACAEGCRLRALDGVSTARAHARARMRARSRAHAHTRGRGKTRNSGGTVPATARPSSRAGGPPLYAP